MLSGVNLSLSYRIPGPFWLKPPRVFAVNDVSITLTPRRTLALVGESGSGKSTTGRLLLGLEKPDSGIVTLDGTQLPKFGSGPWQKMRKQLQLVYQNPLAALDARMKVIDSVREPLIIHDIGTYESRALQVGAALEAVGLTLEQSTRYPHELSGGQVQRAVLARAMITEPELLVCDEPMSALDVSVQAQVMNTLLELQKRMRMAILFISHDLRLVRQIAHEVAVMYLGRIVEQGPTELVLHRPLHPYTKALVSAVPVIGARGQKRIVLAGDPPDPSRPPSGCPFHPRCPISVDRCRVDRPTLRSSADGQNVACHLADFGVEASQ